MCNFTLLYTLKSSRFTVLCSRRLIGSMERPVQSNSNFTLLYTFRCLWKPVVLRKFPFVQICAVDFACTNCQKSNMYPDWHGGVLGACWDPHVRWGMEKPFARRYFSCGLVVHKYVKELWCCKDIIKDVLFLIWLLY